jgi:hypothetical protein
MLPVSLLSLNLKHVRTSSAADVAVLARTGIPQRVVKPDPGYSALAPRLLPLCLTMRSVLGYPALCLGLTLSIAAPLAESTAPAGAAVLLR